MHMLCAPLTALPICSDIGLLNHRRLAGQAPVLHVVDEMETSRPAVQPLGQLLPYVAE